MVDSVDAFVGCCCLPVSEVMDFDGPRRRFGPRPRVDPFGGGAASRRSH
jgi:hypothetical protein